MHRNLWVLIRIRQLSSGVLNLGLCTGGGKKNDHRCHSRFSYLRILSFHFSCDVVWSRLNFFSPYDRQCEEVLDYGRSCWRTACPSELSVCACRLFGTTGYCSACSELIPAFEMIMKARNNVYHLECFACQRCSQRSVLPVQWCKSQWRSGGSGRAAIRRGDKNGVIIREHQASHDFWGRQNCSPPRSPITAKFCCQALMLNCLWLDLIFFNSRAF